MYIVYTVTCISQATEDVIEAAEAAIEEGAFQEAIQVLTDALNAGDSSSLLLLLRGQSHLKAGDPDKALVDLDECLRLEPWFPEAYISRGRCYQVRRRTCNGLLTDFLW